MKKVSIIIPVYNMEDWVESGIKCITEQTYENLEIIIIDDGSKDGTQEIAERYQEKYPISRRSLPRRIRTDVLRYSAKTTKDRVRQEILH